MQWQRHRAGQVVLSAGGCEQGADVVDQGKLTLLEQGSVASFEVAGQYFDIKPAFVETVRNVDMKTRLSSLDKPVLIITIENDALVSEGDARQIEQWASGETRLISIKNSDHLLSDKAATEKVAQDIIQWLRAII